MRSVFVAAGAVAGALLLIAVAVLGFLATSAGRDAAAGWLSAAASNGTVVRIGRIEALTFGRIVMADIAVADRGGPVATVERAAIEWRPAELLRRRLVLDRVAVAGVRLERLPESEETGEEAGDEPAGDGGVLPRLPVDIVARDVTIEPIVVEPAVAGVPATLQARGAVTLMQADRRLDLRLAVERVDRPGDRVGVEIAFAVEPPELAADVTVTEAAGGLLSRALGVPGEPPLSLRLEGTGPPSDWQGRLAASAGDYGEASAGLAAALADESLSLALTDATVGFGPASGVRPLLGNSARLGGRLDWRFGEGLDVRDVSFATDVLAAEGRGGYDVDAAAAWLWADVRLTPGEHWAALPDGVSLGSARLEVDLSGEIERLGGEIRIAARDVAAAAFAAERVDGVFAIEADIGATAASGEGRLEIAGISAPEPLAAVLAPEVIATVSGLRVSASGAAAAQLAVVSGPLRVVAEPVAYAPDRQLVTAEVQVSAESLSPLEQIAGIALQGQARAAATVRYDLASGALAADVDATADLARQAGAASAAPPLVRALGDTVTATAEVRLSGEGRLGIDGLRVRAGAAEASGTVDLAPGGAVAARLQLTAPDAARFGDAAGIDLSGPVDARVRVGGSVTEPDFEIEVKQQALRLSGIDLANLRLQGSVRRRANGLSLDLAGDIDIAGQAVAAKTRATIGEETVRFDDLVLASGANSLTGQLVLDRSRGALAGDLSGRIADVAALPLIGPNATGALDLTVSLEPSLGGAGEVARVQLAGNLAAPGAGVAARGLRVRATIEQPRADAHGSLHAEAAEIAIAGTAVADVTLEASGSARELSASLTGRARLPQASVPVSLAGRFAATEAGFEAALERLTAELPGGEISLAEPLSLSMVGEEVRLMPTRLRIGDGVVALRGTLGAESVDAAVVLEAVPLDPLAPFLPGPAVTGHLSGRIVASGPVAAPDLKANLNTADLALGRGAAGELPPLAVALDADFTRRRLSYTLRATGGEGARIESEGTLPVDVGLRPFSVVVHDNENISARVIGDASLAGLADLALSGEDTVAGRAHVEATVSGTLADPRATGEVTLREGLYESLLTGTVIRDIAVTARLSGERLELVALQGRDPSGGSIAGSGYVELDPEAGFPLSARIELNRFELVSRPEATATVSGVLTAAGSAAQPALLGAITVESAEIRIPDQLPSNARPVEVREINGAEPAGETLSPMADPALEVALDIRVQTNGRIFVRGRGLDSEWRSALAIGGTTANLAVDGAIELVRGTFAFAGRTLQLRSGTIRFPGGPTIQPEIAVVSEVNLPDLLARVSVEGPLAEPRIAFSSEPPLPDEEILSRILFGTGAADLSALQALQLAETVATLSGRFSGPGIVDRVRRRLGVDVLTVESSGESASGATLKAGKYISDKVFLSVRQGTTTGTGSVGIEVEVTPNVTVETDVGGEAQGNLGINLKWDY